MPAEEKDDKPTKPSRPSSRRSAAAASASASTAAAPAAEPQAPQPQPGLEQPKPPADADTAEAVSLPPAQQVTVRAAPQPVTTAAPAASAPAAAVQTASVPAGVGPGPDTSRASAATVPAGTHTAAAVPSRPTSLPKLTPRFTGAGEPFLARFLPDVPASHLGLSAAFCDLYIFLAHLHSQGWNGYLHSLAPGGHEVWVLVQRGRPVAAAANRLLGQDLAPAVDEGGGICGQEALGQLILAYQGGAELAAYPLPASQTQVLSGVGARAQKFQLTAHFTGVYAQPGGAVFYLNGEAAALMEAALPYEGAFPAPASAEPLILPRGLAGWAHSHYTLTLRGRDALSPITAAYQDFRSEFGDQTQGALALLTALARDRSPADYALDNDTPLGEIEPLMSRFREQGYLVTR